MIASASAVAGLSRVHHQRRELDHSSGVKAALMNRDRNLERCREPEVRSDRSGKHRRRAAPILAAHPGPERRHADVGSAAPVTGDLAERREPGPAPRRCCSDAVDAGSDRDRNAVPRSGGSPEHREHVVGDMVLLRPTLLRHGVGESNLLRGKVGAGHEHRRDGRAAAVARPEPGGEPGAINQVINDLDGRPEAELVRR